MSIRSVLKPALLASAFGALSFATAANAQDDGRYSDTAYSSDNETVIVNAPRFHVQRGTQLGVPDKISLSQEVSYSDLDLRSRDDARELRHRVIEAARDVCGRLADQFPYREAPGVSCFRTARQDALIKADAAIRDARD